jgi:hypothetical protein
VLGAAPLLGRGVPDVSLDADPESGYDVIVSGSETAIGGTSASAPSRDLHRTWVWKPDFVASQDSWVCTAHSAATQQNWAQQVTGRPLKSSLNRS